VSALSEAIDAIRKTLVLANDVERLTRVVDSMSLELKNHEHRLIRLEAKWETAIELAQLGGRRGLPGPGL
jgi:hypothetical protein